MVEIDEEIIKIYLLAHTNMSEKVIDKWIEEMTEQQDRADECFENFIDRVL